MWSRAAPSRAGGRGAGGGLRGERRGHWGQPGRHGLGMGGREGDTITSVRPQEDGVPPPSASPRRQGCPIPAPPKADAGTVTSAVPAARSGPQLHRGHRAALQHHAMSPQRGAPPAPRIPSAGIGNPRGPPCAARPRKDPAAPRPLLSAHNKGILHSALPSQQRDAPLPPHPASIN